MAKMYLMCGCSGAGKTTFSKEFAKKHNIKYLGIDDFYASYNGDELDRSNTFEVWIEFWKAIHDAEVNRMDCIIDTNALTVCDRTQFIDWFSNFEHHLIYIETETKLREKNNHSRRRHVPDDVMVQMAKRLVVPSYDSDDVRWKTISIVKNVNNIFLEPIILTNN